MNEGSWSGRRKKEQMDACMSIEGEKRSWGEREREWGRERDGRSEEGREGGRGREGEVRMRRERRQREKIEERARKSKAEVEEGSLKPISTNIHVQCM